MVSSVPRISDSSWVVPPEGGMPWLSVCKMMPYKDAIWVYSQQIFEWYSIQRTPAVIKHNFPCTWPSRMVSSSLEHTEVSNSCKEVLQVLEFDKIWWLKSAVPGLGRWGGSVAVSSGVAYATKQGTVSKQKFCGSKKNEDLQSMCCYSFNSSVQWILMFYSQVSSWLTYNIYVTCLFHA